MKIVKIVPCCVACNICAQCEQFLNLHVSLDLGFILCVFV